MALMIDIVEPQDKILFVTGYVSNPLSVGDVLTKLEVYMPAKKRKQSPKCISETTVSVVITSIIVEGEPMEHITANKPAQIGLIGDIDNIVNLIEDHHWHESNGRYLLPRQETRFIMLSGD